MMSKVANTEQVLSADPLGSDLGLPLIQRVSNVRCHSASRITWHSHPFYELLLLSEGATAYEFQDGRVAELSGGQFLVIPATTVHRGLNDFRKPGSLCGVMIAPNISNACHQTTFAPADIQWIRERLDQASLTPRKMSCELRALVKSLPELIHNFDAMDKESVLRARLRVCQIVLEVAAQLASSASVVSTVVVENAIRFMQTNLDSPTSMVKVAQAVGCSRARLFEIFKETTGLTPNDYWQRIRVEEAYRRLLSTSDSVTKVAMDCGFTTSQYFCTVFRKYWGISPSDCRKTSRPAQSEEGLSH